MTKFQPLAYDHLRLSKSQYIRALLLAAAFLAISGFIFFNSIFLCLVLTILSVFYPQIVRKAEIEKKKDLLTLQFRDALFYISNSISIGRSLTSAFQDAPQELSTLYPDPDTLIIQELQIIKTQTEANVPIARALKQFAEKVNIELIHQFAEIISICHTTGGNLTEAIKNTNTVIIDKINMQNELKVLTASQNLNIKILLLVPYGIVLLLRSASFEYITPLYTPLGNLIVCVALALILCAYLVGKKINHIR